METVSVKAQQQAKDALCKCRRGVTPNPRAYRPFTIGFPTPPSSDTPGAPGSINSPAPGSRAPVLLGPLTAAAKWAGITQGQMQTQDLSPDAEATVHKRLQ